MQLIFANLQETEKKYYTPRDFCKTFNIDGAPVDVRRQQDAQEFFNIILDNIEGHLKGTANENLLKEIIGGEICNEVKSLEEGHEYISQTMEPFFSVQLDIKNRKSIQEALDFYIKPDILEGDNKYYCDKYNTKIKAHKRSFLNKTSNTLIINLKRFEFDYNTFRKYKVNDYCEFPMELNIKPWTKEGIQEKERRDLTKKEEKKEMSGSEEELAEPEEMVKKTMEENKEYDPEENKEEVKEEDNSLYEYEAVGVVVHSGGAEGGHYYSYIKNRDNNKWLEFNDTRVKPFDLKNFAEETFGGDGNEDDNFDGLYARSRNAYLIIYQRKNPLPYETIQITSPDQELVKGIPQSVYQHIWDENMLFMKRMYFFDSEYLTFIREFLSLNHFERKLFTDASPITKEMVKQKEVARVLGVTESDFKIKIENSDVNMFGEYTESNEKLNENKDKSEFEEEDGRILLKTDHIPEEDIQKAKEIILTSSKIEDKDEYMKNLDLEIKLNPALYVIKFSTLFALKIKEHIKDSFQFISLLQNLSSMFDMQADGCMWFLKYLTYNKQMLIEHLLKNKSEDERENFRALLINVIELAAKNEEKDFFKQDSDEYNTEILVEFDNEKECFYAKQTPKSVIVRFMQVFFEEMLDDTREYYKNFEDYFIVLKYFAELGFMETKYLIKAQGIEKLLDFVMNNNPPFHKNKGRKSMGTSISDPNFKVPIDILSHLVRSCVTRGIKNTESYSSVYVEQAKNKHIPLPYQEIRLFMTKLCFSMEMINYQYNDSVEKMVLHLCWEDKYNSKFFIDELIFSFNICKSNINSLEKRIGILKSILQLEDSLQDERIEAILGLQNRKNNEDVKPGLVKLDDNALVILAKAFRKDYPLFTIEGI